MIDLKKKALQKNLWVEVTPIQVFEACRYKESPDWLAVQWLDSSAKIESPGQTEVGSAEEQPTKG